MEKDMSEQRRTLRPKEESRPSKPGSEHEGKLLLEMQDLYAEIRGLEQENLKLRRRLELAPKEFESLHSQLRRYGDQLEAACRRNEQLVAALQKAKAQIEALREEVEKLTSPPSSYGAFLQRNQDGTVDVMAGGRRLRVNLHPSLEKERLSRGQAVILNDALNVVGVAGFEAQGEVARLKEVLDQGRAIISLAADQERVAELADPIKGPALKPGDLVLFDPRSGHLLEKLPKPEVEEVLLEEIPEVDYSMIGGLDSQVEALKDAIELPYLYAEEFREHKLLPPKGVLLYGPPGCGKTLIAKAMANSLAKKVAEMTGKEPRSYFFNIKGPELLDKYVGETERKIREVFRRAREKAKEGMPVVIFFDEMDALFRTRGSGISSDVESSIVPQLLSEIDGVEGLDNVIVVGASNRQDLIDPAVLRPGRMNVKIKVDRPDKQAAREIFSKYLTEDLPFSSQELEEAQGERRAVVERLIQKGVEEIYSTSDASRFLEVTYANGDKEILYFKDFASGAMIENVVARAKKLAIKRAIAGGAKGIAAQDLVEAVRQEFKDNEDLPNTTNPDDWVKISGRRSEKIIHVRSIASRDQEKRKVETITSGHYL